MPERGERGGRGPGHEGARWGAFVSLGAAQPRCTDVGCGRTELCGLMGPVPLPPPPTHGWALPKPPENHRPGRGQSRWEDGVQVQRTPGPRG